MSINSHIALLLFFIYIIYFITSY